MADESHHEPDYTRRRYLTAGGVALGASVLAGCTSNTESTSTTDGSATAASEMTTSDGTETDATETTAAAQTPYTVAVEPYGETTFDAVPERYVTSGGAWTDIGFAFGSEPAATSRLEHFPTHYYDALPGITFDASNVDDLGNPSEYSKEQFYELDVDALFIDKILLASYADWDTRDFAEVSENVAPFCASYLRNGWTGQALGMEFSFPYYTLTDAIELTGELFQDQARADAWVSLHESFRADLRSTAPGDSPSAGLLYSASDPSQGSFMVADPTVDGIATRQYRTFDVANAFADVDLTDGWKTDYEGVLEADPDYLFFDSTLSMSRDQFETELVEPLADHPVGSELTAVQNGDVYRGGGRYQGPIVNLFQTEMLAKQLYPDAFGEPAAAADVPTSERLFDRERVSSIVDGET